MPESMFDKLGELLSEAIDSGIFFEERKKTSDNKNTESFSKSANSGENKAENTEECIKNNTNKNKHKQNKTQSAKTVYKNIQSNTSSQFCIVSNNKKLIKYAHPEVQKACTFVGVTEGMCYEEAKKQFHKKLLRFHPDRNADNEVMKKITKEKTDELLKAWALIEKWYTEN